jgi:hypothetical protein
MLVAAICLAGSNGTRAATYKELHNASAIPTPPAKKKANKVVGTCNTSKGCKALKETCKSLRDHTFKATEADGSLGVCINEYDPATRTFFLRNSNSPGSPTNPTASGELAAPTKQEKAVLYCHGNVFCRKVKNICAALGGTYTPIYDLSGACNY